MGYEPWRISLDPNLGKLVMATAQYSVACEVSRQTGRTFEQALYHVRSVWPNSDDECPTTREGYMDVLVEITTNAVARAERKGVGE